MSLVLPSEIVVDRFLPTVRTLLARRLGAEGFTQQEIADRLGVTQAAVSKYLSDDGSVETRFAEDARTVETVDRIASGFASGEMDGYDALAELLGLVREFEDRGPICAAHEEAMPELDGLGCDLCVRGTDESVRAERTVLATVRKAARILATTPELVSFIPNVGTNVGMALPAASDPADVAAIPGRIYAMEGRVKVPANPAFGASKHVATTILTIREFDDGVRAALNLAPSDALLAAARDRGIEPLEFSAEEKEPSLRARLQERGTVPRLIYHPGAFGIEPIAYVLAPDAVAAAELAADLVCDAT